MSGLLRTGGVKEENKPIWFEIWKAFPPKVDPVLDRPVDEKPLRQILYPEDKVRAESMKQPRGRERNQPS